MLCGVDPLIYRPLVTIHDTVCVCVCVGCTVRLANLVKSQFTKLVDKKIIKNIFTGRRLGQEGCQAGVWVGGQGAHVIRDQVHL